ncbi:hypothetical protein UP10_09020 [Bradyrhizobium sp. LTSPM299]|nr:hypothetical protein UP10_09020 [Bradyrhizobium sp. LTSPM299]
MLNERAAGGRVGRCIGSPRAPGRHTRNANSRIATSASAAMSMTPGDLAAERHLWQGFRIANMKL